MLQLSPGDHHTFDERDLGASYSDRQKAKRQHGCRNPNSSSTPLDSISDHQD